MHDSTGKGAEWQPAERQLMVAQAKPADVQLTAQAQLTAGSIAVVVRGTAAGGLVLEFGMDAESLHNF